MTFYSFLGGAAGGGYSQVIPMEEVCLFEKLKAKKDNESLKN